MMEKMKLFLLFFMKKGCNPQKTCYNIDND